MVRKRNISFIVGYLNILLHVNTFEASPYQTAANTISLDLKKDYARSLSLNSQIKLKLPAL